VAADYYAILGVQPDATVGEIKAAYRAKAKALHPDHNPGDSEPFRAVQEAYETLCDAARRRAYDARCARPVPVRRATRRPPAEPLSPRQPTFRPARTQPGLRTRSLLEEILEAWREWDSGPGEFQAEVNLTPYQARHGGRIRVWIPVEQRCPSCQGSGVLGFFACPWCSGLGYVAREAPVDIAYPGGIGDGYMASLSLDELGLGTGTLTLHFRVSPW
jgi:hypothetical protein